MNNDSLKALGGVAAILLGLYALKERASSGVSSSSSTGSAGTYSEAVIDAEEPVSEVVPIYPNVTPDGISVSSGVDPIQPVVTDNYYDYYTPVDYSFMPTAKQAVVPVVEESSSIPDSIVITPITMAEAAELTNVPYALDYTPAASSEQPVSNNTGAVDTFTTIVDTANTVTDQVYETVHTVSVDPVVNTVVSPPVVNAIDLGKDVAQTVVNAVVNSDNPVDAFTNVVETVANTGKQTVDTVVNTTQTVVNNFVETGTKAVDAAKDVISNAGQTVNNWVDSWKWW